VHDARRTSEIALRTFVMARWVVLALIALGWSVQHVTPAAFEQIISWFPPSPEPRGTAAIMVILAALNLGTQRWVLAGGRSTPNLAGAHLLIDATSLTVLLALSGGLINSFTTMYFVPITLATQISPRWTWTVSVYCLVMFASLFALGPVDHSHAAHDFEAHLRGMWVAFAISGVLITYFVHRIAISLEKVRHEVARLRFEAAQDRHLAAMGTLAAGAAHELGSPLGTIRMLVDDLNLMEGGERNAAISTISEEVGRCKHIIHQMASPELRLPALGLDSPRWSLREITVDLPKKIGDVSVTIVMSEAFHGSHERCSQPQEVLGQILRELLNNAAEACRRRPESAGVRVQFDLVQGCVSVLVEDDGVGMGPEVAMAAFDPFFSTREEGQGMGLGLYLARAHLRQLGGSIKLTSELGVGSTFRVRFPLVVALDRGSGPVCAETP